MNPSPSFTLPLPLPVRRPPAEADWRAALRRLHGAVRTAIEHRQRERIRARLLRCAERLEATEPSYAADLRAAALGGPER